MATTAQSPSGSIHAESVLDEVRAAIAPEDEVLAAARERRDAVKKYAEAFRGRLRTFNSGSVAHGTANNPVSDADCGVVLDRRHHGDLGPDGDDVGPCEIVDELVEEITPKIKDDYSDAEVSTTKRAVLVEFNEPVDDEDPSVDLIVGLSRAEDDALWIPNLEADDWDASDPEEHTRLLVAKPADLRRHRARVLRLAKAAIRNDGDQRVMCSFNIEALALTHVTEVHTTLAEGLAVLLEGAAESIAKELTPDPADVSDPIKLPEGVTRADCSARLGYFARKVREAIAAYSEAGARAALADVFRSELGDKTIKSTKSKIADELRQDERDAAVLGSFGAAAGSVKPTRAFGTLR